MEGEDEEEEEEEGDARRRRTAVRFGGGKKMCVSSIEGWLLRAVLKSPRDSGKAQRARLDDLVVIYCEQLIAAIAMLPLISYLYRVVLMFLNICCSVHSANLASTTTVSTSCTDTLQLIHQVLDKVQ